MLVEANVLILINRIWKGKLGSGLVFCFCSYKRNFQFVLMGDCGRLLSFCKWAGERGKISSWSWEISVLLSFLLWNFISCVWDFWGKQKTRPDPLYDPLYWL